jgi:hypothetical protein
MYKCPVCKKLAKRLATHHFIPRYFSISTDDDTMECCVSCHRKFDIAFTNLILWGTLEPPNWIDKNRLKKTLANWRDNNRPKLRQQNEAYRVRQRLKYGIVHRPKIRTQYPDINEFKEKLVDLYWNRKMSLQETADELHLSHSCIEKWFKWLMILKRARLEAIHLRIGKHNKKRIIGGDEHV